MPAGVVKAYHPDRGFGFIRPLDGSRDVFFHVTEFESADHDPILGSRVGYEVGRSRTAAAKIDPAKGQMAVAIRYI